jgi:hypothetical protein
MLHSKRGCLQPPRCLRVPEHSMKESAPNSLIESITIECVTAVMARRAMETTQHPAADRGAWHRTRATAVFILRAHEAPEVSTRAFCRKPNGSSVGPSHLSLLYWPAVSGPEKTLPVLASYACTFQGGPAGGSMSAPQAASRHGALCTCAAQSKRPSCAHDEPGVWYSSQGGRAGTEEAERGGEQATLRRCDAWRWVAGAGRGEAAAGKGKSGGELRRGMNEGG